MLFSAELPWCCLCAGANVLGMTWNFMEQLFGKYNKYLQKMKARGPPPVHEGGGHACPPRACPLPHGPPGAPPTPTPTLYIWFQGEKIREKNSSRFTIRSRRQALKPLGRADLESVRGSGEGDSSPSSSSTILHHQFHDAHRREWVIPSLACWTVMGWMRFTVQSS